ncbi:hypothetical protein DBR40_19895 [Pedobacter sp. KBW01]|uniref:glucosaminidase domain-containing protein n=1 Tax=Pedobacter sp. KBW01 TaxID=2153364 RepID=UPI000F5B489D|nr:glucosaminidase domain-containing protein [Pedobacter sp. KBW01]RQO68506.1 hypothetical protein DBR40_19895 [Pedobacter sp. KBW01]
MRNIKKFIELNGADIVAACVGTGLFPSVLMGQIIQESSGDNGEFGLSGLAYKYNNYAGIKAWGAYTGKRVKLKTGEQTKAGKNYTVYADFCFFENFKDFLKWRTVFLNKNKNYVNSGVFKAKTPFEQITALKKAGYATDVNYVSRVYAHITSNGLMSLDEQLKKKVVPVLENPLKSKNTWFKNLLETFSLTIDTTTTK